MNDSFTHALAMARAGFYVLPIKPGCKFPPLLEHGYLDATWDVETVKGWGEKYPNANWAVAAKPSGLVIPDIDCHVGRADGKSNLKKLLDGRTLPKTVTVKTPTGYHLWFLAPEGVEFKDKLCPGVDIKFKGYALLPGSIHPDGGQYEYVPGRSPYDIEELANFPDFLYPHAIKSKNANGTADYAGKNDLDEAAQLLKDLPVTYPPSDAKQVIANCALMKACCIDNAENLDEPTWYASTVGVLSFCTDGADYVHQYSEPYPGYSFDETETKIKHRLADSGPSTCKNLQEVAGDQHCQKCPYYKKIKSPIVLGYQSWKVLDDKSKPVAFPIDALPGVLGDFARAAARSIRCPVDFAACSVLLAASVAVGGNVRLQLTSDWFVRAVLWLALVGDPGIFKKSPPLRLCCIEPLKPLTDKLQADHDVAMVLYQADHQMYLNVIKVWKDKKVKDAPMPVAPVEPVERQIMADDITIEALAEVLKNNGGSVGIVVDELTGWLRAMNQYKAGGRGADRSRWLSIRNSMPITVNRKGQKPLYVRDPFVPLGGGLQPDVLTEVKGSGNLDDGGLERISYSCPLPSKIAVRDAKPIPADIKIKFYVCIQKLYENRALGERIVELSHEANECFLDTQEEWERLMNSPDFPKELLGFYSKAPGQLGELTLLLHEMRRATDETFSDLVSEETVLKAKQLVDYFLEHGRRALKLLSANREERRVEQMVKWIKRKDLVAVAPRDLVTYGVAGVKRKSEAIALVKAAADFGYGWFDSDTCNLIIPKLHSQPATDRNGSSGEA